MTLHINFLIEFENLAWRNKATTTNWLAFSFMLFMSVINCDTKFYFSCIYTSNMSIIIHVISILRFTVIRILAWSRHRGKLVQSVAPTWRRFKGAKSLFCFHDTFHDDSSWKYAVSIYFNFNGLEITGVMKCTYFSMDGELKTNFRTTPQSGLDSCTGMCSQLNHDFENLFAFNKKSLMYHSNTTHKSKFHIRGCVCAEQRIGVYAPKHTSFHLQLSASMKSFTRVCTVYFVAAKIRNDAAYNEGHLWRRPNICIPRD